MRYNLQFDLPPVPVSKPVNLRVPEPIWREFKFATDRQNRTMTEVLITMMTQFTHEYKTRGIPKQTSFV